MLLDTIDDPSYARQCHVTISMETKAIICNKIKHDINEWFLYKNISDINR